MKELGIARWCLFCGPSRDYGAAEYAVQVRSRNQESDWRLRFVMDWRESRAVRERPGMRLRVCNM